MKLLSLLLLASALFAQPPNLALTSDWSGLCARPWCAAPAPPPIRFFVAGNFPRDLWAVDTGIDATPNGIWGNEDAETLPIQFYPPAGYHVEILEIHGNLVAGVKIVGQQVAIPAGSAGYVLVGFSTTALIGYPGPGVACNYCAIGCMIYLQGALAHEPVTIPFDRVFPWPIPLEPDGILNLKLASFLNNTGFPIHAEATYNILGRFVPD